MMTRAIVSVVLGLGLVACGGGSKPAAQEPAGEEAPAAADPELCCCDYIEETGEGDTMAENQMYSMMPAADCADAGGSCGDAAACDAPAE